MARTAFVSTDYWARGGGGGGSPSISAFYSVKLCIRETRIHNTPLYRGSCDLSPIFLFQMFGNCDNAFASLTSFSLPTLLLISVVICQSHSFLSSIFPIVSIELSFSEELIKELLLFFSVVRFFPSLVC